MSKSETARFMAAIAVLTGTGCLAAFLSALLPKDGTAYGALHLLAVILLGFAMVVCLVAIFRILRAGRRDHSDHH